MSVSGPVRIRRVTGPLVEVDAFAGVAMNDLVALGPDRLPAEVVAIGADRVTLQSYEYTGGLGPGDPVTPLAHPLSARLYPGLLGGVFDGLLRPLADAPTWLEPGRSPEADGRRWSFRPAAHAGETVTPGTLLGIVAGAGSLEYRVLTPPGRSGHLDMIAAAGEYDDDDVIATVGGAPVTLTEHWPVRVPRPRRGRQPGTAPLQTGQRAVDLLFPVLRGGSVSVPGGFGTGKTMLLQQLAKWCDADVIVYVGCGERGNEMAEIVAELLALIDPRTGGPLAQRTVIIANTSNMAMMAREASVYTGVTVAEFFRDMGYHTVLVADSTSRWAEALREFASRTGALPAEEGYPANLASALAAFYERAGVVTTLGGASGSVTIVGAVSPPGGDVSEPVTIQTERFVRCRWTLDRDLAYARHYPAVSWSNSFARDVETVTAGHAADGDDGWGERRARAVRLLAEADRLTALTELMGAGALPPDQRMIILGARLLREGVLQQNALSDNDARCTGAKAAALVEATLAVTERCRARVADGVAAQTVETFDFGPLVRVRETAGPDDVAAVRQIRDAVLTGLGGLT
ncbi:V-type ATP synthase subunit A [Nocardia seriolae]|uniref:ATPase n=1 Tax=Nocardia seriolae TaxID=37332 RepID=A0A0B8NNJ9_9NOCA|nr:V-type ATP synthase subunit A [Nocardia seriolae]APA98432.1 H(+)-transporting two-sector ATPase [Nocardia seriolae]MTJ64104.1 V-type ATP synthase subunit A [Nocardia seriolae]MTJ73643.1 V-type ATP synthase subunit A [Nocardia seriolae]MTJ88116.1 V-type ATP synthase subunit A [Nocardia seriolae]MTK32106.1 V-type ATP synthase subunit A [Nocardia seriolae]